MERRNLDTAVQEMCKQAVYTLRESTTGEKRKGAEWLLTVGIRYLQTQGAKVDPVAYDLYRMIDMDAVEVILPRRKSY